ncbi:MAG: radical SAM protein [Candidatus Aminicenantes bacterium]|nr:radical SAM protein [Candidatus Aminicenantes bacterium]
MLKKILKSPQNSERKSGNFSVCSFKTIKDLLLEITYACNLRCRHCSSVGIFNENWQRAYHSLTSLLSEYDVERIRISGGEPTVTSSLKWWIDIIRNERKFEGKLVLQTNGTVYYENDEIDEYWISLYGSKDFHEKITGVRRSFDETLSTIEMHVRKGHRVILQTPIFAETQIEDFSNLINKHDFLQNLPVRLTRLLPHGCAEFMEVLPAEEQYKIAKKMPNRIITCSLDQSRCIKYMKKVILPNGNIRECASCKHGKILCR